MLQPPAISCAEPRRGRRFEQFVITFLVRVNGGCGQGILCAGRFGLHSIVHGYSLDLIGQLPIGWGVGEIIT